MSNSLANRLQVSFHSQKVECKRRKNCGPQVEINLCWILVSYRPSFTRTLTRACLAWQHILYLTPGYQIHMTHKALEQVNVLHE